MNVSLSRCITRSDVFYQYTRTSVTSWIPLECLYRHHSLKYHTSPPSNQWSIAVLLPEKWYFERFWVRCLLFLLIDGHLLRNSNYHIILLLEKFLQFDWLRAVVFQLNLKYLWYKQIIAWFVRDIWHKYHSWYFKIVSNFNYVYQFWNITRGIYAKYHYKSCYYLIQISSVTLKDYVGGLWLGRDKMCTRGLLPILHTSCELRARPEADTFLSCPQWRIVN